MDTPQATAPAPQTAPQAEPQAEAPPATPAVSAPSPGFDRAVDALSRLPRPAAALGALLLFGFATLDPEGFEARMQALAAMPDELWWILGGVLTFYFGAREAHYFRSRPAPGRTDRPGGQG